MFITSLPLPRKPNPMYIKGCYPILTFPLLTFLGSSRNGFPLAWNWNTLMLVYTLLSTTLLSNILLNSRSNCYPRLPCAWQNQDTSSAIVCTLYQDSFQGI